MDNLKLEYIWISSHQYEGWEVPWSAVCELESQGRWTYSWNQRPEKQKNQRYKFQSYSEILWTGSADSVTSSPKAEEDHVLTHSVRQRVNSSFLCLFILLRPSTDWILSTHTRERKFYQFKCYSYPETFSRHIQKQFSQILGHPVTSQNDISSHPPQMDMELSHVDVQSMFSFQVTIHIPF